MPILYQNIVNDATFATGVVRRVAGMAFIATGTGAANKIRVFTNAAGHQFKVGIYDNASPIANAALIGSESNIETSVANGFVDLTLPTPANLVSGQTYRFAICANTHLNIFGANNAISQTRQNGSTLAAITDPLPNPWAAATATSSGMRMPYVIIESTEVSISSIDQNITGRTSTANFNAPFAPTSFNITGDGVTKNAAATIIDADSASFVMPQWEDGETAVRLGAVTINATDGTVTTTDFNATLTMEAQHPDAGSPTAFSSVILGTLDPDATVTIPVLQAGDQVAYDPLRMNVRTDGIVEPLLDTETTSSSVLYVRNSVSKLITEVFINTGSPTPPEPEPEGGLSMRGITAITLSMKTPSMVAP